MLAGTDCGTVSHVLLASCAHRSPTDGGTSAVRRRGPSRAGGAPVALRRVPSANLQTMDLRVGSSNLSERAIDSLRARQSFQKFPIALRMLLLFKCS